MRLSDFSVVSFDCYGTLIDWETGLLAELAPLLRKADTDPEQALQEFARLETQQEARTPAMRYSDLLALVYQGLAETWNLRVTSEEAG